MHRHTLGELQQKGSQTSILDSRGRQGKKSKIMGKNESCFFPRILLT
jgi:hypothetical protein